MIRTALQKIVIQFSVVVAISIVVGAATAQQNSKLQLIGLSPGGAELASTCEGSWDQIQAYVNQTRQLIGNNQIDKIQMKKLGPMNVEIQRLSRAGRRLQHLREPAGLDYSLRAAYARPATASELCDALARNTKQGQQLRKKAEEYKVKSQDKRVKEMQRIRELLSENKIGQAEAEFEKVLEDIDEFLPWLESKSQLQISDLVDPVRRKVNQEAIKIRNAQSAEALTKAIKANPPNIDQLLNGVQAAAKSIATSESVNVGGEMATGPAAVKGLFSQWQTAHANLLKCKTYHWLGAGLKMPVTPADSIGGTIGLEDWDEAASKLSAKMAELLPQVIAADLKRTSDDSTAKAKYIQYLTTIGFMAGKSAEPVVAACENELAILETRSGALATEIKNYKKATADILLWRKRAAAAQASKLKRVPDPVATNTFPCRQYFSPNLGAGLHVLAPQLQTESQNKPAFVSNVQMINDKAGFSRYQTETWATVMGQIDLSDEFAKLRSDLFVGQGSPPLSPAAAKSILMAQRKQLVSLGGTITSGTVESVGARFGKLPASMTSFVPLSETVPSNDELGQTMLRIVVKPEWVQHEHFFKKLN